MAKTKPKTLVIDLVGRICLVKGKEWKKGKEHGQIEPDKKYKKEPEEEDNKGLWAVFLNARANRQLGLRKHVPLLSVPLSMVKSQEVADEALLTGVTFVKRLQETDSYVDSLGMWKLAGQDMTISGIAAEGGKVRIREVANLNAIVASVDKTATFESRILDSDPSGFGVLARLWLPASANVTAITEDSDRKTFQPGGHTQKIATYVRCEIPFADDVKAPVLRTRQFNNGRRFDYRFSAQSYGQVTVTMSNLCNCVNETTEYGPDATSDDPEFRVYYQLVRTVLDEEPVPTIPRTSGARQIPVCFSLVRLDLRY
jgi:hypothetical protein